MVVKKPKKQIVEPPNHKPSEDISMSILENRITHLEVCNSMLINAVKMLKEQVKELLEKDNSWKI